jgi:hypothetical protein
MDVTKTYLSWDDIVEYTIIIHEKLLFMNWVPNLVVGLTRGGLLPATLLSHRLGVRMNSLDVSLRDGSGEGKPILTMSNIPVYMTHTSKILIVDDINDSGETFEWIRTDWLSRSASNDLMGYGKEWPSDIIKFAALLHNEPSTSTTDVYAKTINKDIDPQWIVFPWEIGKPK